MSNKILIILTSVLIATIVVSIIILGIQNQVSVKQSPTPQPIFSPVPQLEVLPGIDTKKSSPLVKYDSQASDKLIDKVQNRVSLSTSNALARKTLIDSLGDKSGVLLLNDKIKLEYLVAPNIFQVEILTNDINQAKQEAVEYLKAKGLSSDGICNLPLMFYLNTEVTLQLTGKNIIFNPLPDGC